MDDKSSFLNCYIPDEVYVHQPHSFESNQNLDFVFKLKNICMV